MHNLSNLDKLGTQYLKYQYIQAQNFLIWTKLHPTVRKKKLSQAQYKHYLKYQLIASTIWLQNFLIWSLIWTKLQSYVRTWQIKLSPKHRLSQISTHCKHSLVQDFIIWSQFQFVRNIHSAHHCKVRIFLEALIIWKNLPHGFDVY